MARNGDEQGWQEPSTPWEPQEPAAETPAKTKRPKIVVVAVALGVIAVLGGAVFAASQLRGDATSPEDAAARLLTAVENEDVLGMLESLLPSEREVLREPIVDLVDELERLGILSNVNLSNVSGVDFDFSGLKYSSKRLADDLASVSVTQGRLKTTVEPAKLPQGDVLRDLTGQVGTNRTTEEDDATGQDVLVTKKQDGRWYVSIWYTVAESGRTDSGAPFPDRSRRLQPRGASTPEAAVDEFLRGAARLDVRRMLELLPPDEAVAVHDYAPLFLDDAVRSANEAKRAFESNVRALQLTAKTSGDRALVQVKDFSFEAILRDEGVRIAFDDGCATYSPLNRRGGEQRYCADDVASAPDLLPGFFGGLSLPNVTVGRPELGFVAVREDGAWYVSPTRTVLDNVVAMLRAFDRQDVDAFVDFFEGFFGAS